MKETYCVIACLGYTYVFDNETCYTGIISPVTLPKNNNANNTKKRDIFIFKN